MSSSTESGKVQDIVSMRTRFKRTYFMTGGAYLCRGTCEKRSSTPRRLRRTYDRVHKLCSVWSFFRAPCNEYAAPCGIVMICRIDWRARARVFQELALYDEFNIQETLHYFGSLYEMSHDDIKDKGEKLMNVMEIPSATAQFGSMRYATRTRTPIPVI